MLRTVAAQTNRAGAGCDRYDLRCFRLRAARGFRRDVRCRPPIRIASLAGLLEAVLAEDRWRSAGCWRLVAVQNIGVEVDSARPANGPGRAIERDSTENLVVIDGRKDAIEGACEVEFANQAVRERNAQAACAEMADFRDARKGAHGRHSTGEARC